MNDPYDDDEVPEGGSFDPEPDEDRQVLFVAACRSSLPEIRQHRHESHVKIVGLLELLMIRHRSRTLLVDYRPQLKAAVVFCNRLGAVFLKCGPLCVEWQVVIGAAINADLYDPDAWFERGYRTTLLNYITAALLVSQCLSEVEGIGAATDSDPYISDWLRALYSLGPSDIPF
jgi:hypothetical protein